MIGAEISKIAKNNFLMIFIKTPIRYKSACIYNTFLRTTFMQINYSKKHITDFVNKESNKLKPSVKKVGVDVAIKEFAICSNGEKFANPKHLRKGEDKLKKLQRCISRQRQFLKLADPCLDRC